MEGASTLELLAELAVGVLGFSGIVVAIGRRQAGKWTPIDQRRFFSMVLIGALVIVLALLPFPLHHAGLDGASLWGWSSGIAAPLILLTVLQVVRGSPGGTARGLYRDPQVSNAVLTFALLATYGAPLILLLNAAGIFFEKTFAPYLFAVLLNFVVTLLTFIRLLHGTWGGGDGEPTGTPEHDA
ncbi:MAG: hypothetical protein ABFS41_18875 [Myxococcota bacterium]